LTFFRILIDWHQMTDKVRKKVLVVEDEENMARLCREELEDEGYEVTVAFSGLKGLELFKSAAPDIVTLDIKLPDLDGMELLRQMKSLRPEVPVIILTAYDYMYDFMVCDADGYLVKSPNLAELKNKIRAVFEDRASAGKSGGPEGLKEDRTVPAFAIREEHLEALKAIGLREKKSIEDIIDDALRSYLGKKG
jgi:DNA-binding response OmpR family regulator